MKNDLILKLTDFKEVSSFFEKMGLAFKYESPLPLIIFTFILVITLMLFLMIVMPKGSKSIPGIPALVLAGIALMVSIGTPVMSALSTTGTGHYESEKFTTEYIKHYSKSDFGEKYERIELKPKGKNVVYIDALKSSVKDISPDNFYKLTTNKKAIKTYNEKSIDFAEQKVRFEKVD